jgi:hypothetical protein
MKAGVASLTVDMTTPNDDWFLVKANMPSWPASSASR